MPYDDDPRWTERARLISPARARQDIEASRPPAKPGLRHLVRVLAALRSGETVALYSACRGNLELLAVVLGRLAFRSSIGTVLFTGDMWNPGTGLRLRVLRGLLRWSDAVVTRWVVHTAADIECFVDVWGIDRSKIDLAPFGFTPDWDRYPPLERGRPYIFAGGNSYRDYRSLLAAVRARPEVSFVFATSNLSPDQVPPNVELIPVDRPIYQAALVGASAVIVPLRRGLRRSVGQQTYLNAMRAGRLPVVVDSPGVDEYVTSGVDGLVVDGSVDGYLDAIDLVTDPDNAATCAAMAAMAVVAASAHSFAEHPRRILDIIDGLDRDAEDTLDQGPIRVAMLLQSYLPVVGGAQRQLAQLMPRFSDRSIQPVVVAGGIPDAPGREQLEAGEVVRISVEGSGVARSIGFTIGALRELRRRRPEVIHAFDLLSPTTTALLAKLLWRTPVVTKVLRGGQLGDLERLRVKPFGQLRLQLMRRLIDRVIVISDEIGDELIAAGFTPEQLVRVENGVDIDHFAPVALSERAHLRRILGLNDGPVVIFTGRLDREKRVDLLISQWQRIVDEIEGATLLIVGDGPERAALTRAAPAGVRFVGRVNDVTPYLLASDVFVLPSETEGLSNSLLEAMASGLAVVCTKVGGAGDIIDHYGNGVLVAPGDGPALGEALIELLGDGRLRGTLGVSARVSMIEGFSLSATADRLVCLYGELARNR